MSAALTPLITEAGWQAITRAKDAEIKVAIQSIALGSHGQIVTGTERQLHTEMERVAIAQIQNITAQQIQLTALVTGALEYWIYELGIYLEDGTLFAYWSDAQTPLAYKAKNIDLVLTLDLIVSTVPSEQLTFITTNSTDTLSQAQALAQLATTCIDILRRQVEHGAFHFKPGA